MREGLPVDGKASTVCAMGQARRIRGFTLLELMLTVCILGAVAGIAVPAYTGHMDKVRSAEAMARITEMQLLLEKFYAEQNRLPETLDEIGMGDLRDPWGRPYVYLNIVSCAAKSPAKTKNGKILCNECRMLRETHPLNLDYDLYSSGKDGRSARPLTAENSWDDVVRAYDGSFIGLGKDLI